MWGAVGMKGEEKRLTPLINCWGGGGAGGSHTKDNITLHILLNLDST